MRGGEDRRRMENISGLYACSGRGLFCHHPCIRSNVLCVATTRAVITNDHH